MKKRAAAFISVYLILFCFVSVQSSSVVAYISLKDYHSRAVSPRGNTKTRLSQTNCAKYT